ncbi:MAG: hypothetical protein D6763_09115 [Alphaproteobacteria bacterium]|nr:MAG: hypothetical protein D6763_09115 [Alphaproteobacteria bacterium]
MRRDPGVGQSVDPAPLLETIAEAGARDLDRGTAWPEVLEKGGGKTGQAVMPFPGCEPRFSGTGFAVIRRFQPPPPSTDCPRPKSDRKVAERKN